MLIKAHYCFCFPQGVKGDGIPMILEPRKIKSDSVSTVSPSISHELKVGKTGNRKAGNSERSGQKSPLTCTDSAPSVTEGDTDIRSPLSVWCAGGGRGSARPGALSFHSGSAPFLKTPRSATPGDARVGLTEGRVGGK